MEKVSIILPVYNSENTIENCILSIINQTYTNFELIIINDGSTDDTINIIKKYLKKDARIRLVNKKNDGVSKSRNIGLSLAEGEFIQFVDADDLLNENMVSMMMDNMIKNKSDLVISGYKINYLGSNNEESVGINKRYFGTPADLIYDLFNDSLLFMIWNKLYRKNLIKNEFNENISLAEDAIFNLEYMKYCQKIDTITEPLYIYRLSKDSGLHLKFSETDFETDIMLYKKIKDISSEINANNIYIDSVQRTIQRMVFNSSLNFQQKKEYINNAISNMYFQNALNNYNFEDIQHKYFIILFKNKKIRMIVFSMHLKKILLRIIRR